MSAANQNPFDTPRPRGIPQLQGTLRVAVAIQCFGTAAARLHLGQTDPFLELVSRSRDLPADQLTHLTQVAAYLLIASGILTLIRPCSFVLLPVIVYYAGTPVSAVLGGEKISDLMAPALQATHWAVPLALLLIDFWPPRIKATLILCVSAVGLLRLASAVTFGAMGILCLIQALQGGELVELVSLVAERGLHRELTVVQTERCLALIGAMEFALAYSLLTSRNRSAALLMVFWGLAAAFSHTLAFGKAGYADSLVRVSEAAAPLAVLIFWVRAVRERGADFVPERTELSHH